MDILDLIKTTEERNKLLSDIELVTESIYKDEGQKVLDNQTSKTVRDYLGPQNSRDTLLQKLSDLKKSLDALEVVKLTLAFDPKDQTIERLIGFLRQNLGQKIILDFELDPKILGGVIFEFRGLYKDYTLQSRLDEVFKTNKNELSIL